MPTLSSNIVKREVASVEDVEEALARQAQYGGDLPTNLLELASVSERDLALAIADSLGLAAAPAGELPSATDRVRRMVPRDVVQRYALYPLEEREGAFVVAVAEPLPPEVQGDLEFSLGLPLVQQATTLIRVRQAIARDYDVELERRFARLLERLAGRPDPHPSTPAAGLAPPHADETPIPNPETAPHAAAMAVSAPAEPVQASSPPKKPKGKPSIDLRTMVRSERRPDREVRRRGPYTVAMAEADLLEAETRDDVVSAFFTFCSQYFEYAALFAVQGDLAEGRDATGSGASRARVLGLGVPLDLPSTLAQVVATEPYRLARLSASGLDAALAKDLERRPGPSVLLLPIRVRDRAVMILYGDHGDSDVNLDAIGNVLSFAPLVSVALERLILRRKERARGGVPREDLLPRPDLGRMRRSDVPRRGERASALASLVNSSSTLSRPPPPPEGAERPQTSPPLVRPVISIGPRAPLITPSIPAPAALRPPGLPSAYPLPSRSRTPIPSSFAPGAPPHTPILQPTNLLSNARGEGSGDAAAFEEPEPNTKPGVGSPPPRLLAKLHRGRTPIHMPAPPAPGSPAPPEVDASLSAEVFDALSPAPAAPAAEQKAPPLDDPNDYPELDPDEVTETTAGDSPELQVTTSSLDDEQALSAQAAAAQTVDLTQLMPEPPRSRSVAHSARPLAAPGSAQDLRLPAVIVDLAQDTEELVGRLISGDPAAAQRLVQIGAAAVPALVGAFPGPITAELRRGHGDGPPRASECGPILKVLALIGPKAAGVLSARSNDKDSTVRAWATRLLGEMPCGDAARAVARRFIDDDAEVRRAALAAGRMLSSHPNSALLLSNTLSEMLLDSTRRDRLQHMVIEAIADLREARAIPTLTTLLAAGSPEIQRSAQWALVVLTRTDCGEDAAAWEHWWHANLERHRIEWLIDALMHENQEIRRAAGDELKSLTKEYFGYYDDLPPRERERAQKRYRDWWDSKGRSRFS
jgi:hypothetical protein